MSKDEKRTDYRKTKKYKTLRDFMLKSLELRKLDGKVYTDKIEEYMDGVL